MISKWDLRFLELANQIATWSKDPSTKVGAVIADGKHVVSIGYNGFPPGWRITLNGWKTVPPSIRLPYMRK